MRHQEPQTLEEAKGWKIKEHPRPWSQDIKTPASPGNKEASRLTQRGCERRCLPQGLPLLKPRPHFLLLSNEGLRFSALGYQCQFTPLPRSPASVQRCPTPTVWRLAGPLPFPLQFAVPPLAYETPPPLHPLLADIGRAPAAVPRDWSPWMMVTGEIPPPVGAGDWGHCSTVLGLAA